MNECEKIMTAIENCIAVPKCRDCPWEPCSEMDCERVDMPLGLVRDALELLKEQDRDIHDILDDLNDTLGDNIRLQELLESKAPRVMMLEEVQALHKNDVVWLEDKDKPNIIPGIIKSRHLWPHSATTVTNFMRGDGCTITAGDDDYGIRWRCWTSRPTDGQRGETQWE